MSDQTTESERLKKLSEARFEIEKSLRLAAFRALNPKASKGGVAFAGDSITEGFPLHEMLRSDKPMFNRGISGDTTRDVLGKLRDVALDLEPGQVFLHIGSNDLPQGERPEKIVRRVEEICARIQAALPNAQLLIEAVYPVNPGEGAKRLVASPYPIHTIEEANSALLPLFGRRTNSAIREINAGLLELIPSRNWIFIDTYPILADEDGQLKSDYTYDGLHLTVKGYEAVAEEIQKYIGRGR